MTRESRQHRAAEAFAKGEKISGTPDVPNAEAQALAAFRSARYVLEDLSPPVSLHEEARPREQAAAKPLDARCSKLLTEVDAAIAAKSWDHARDLIEVAPTFSPPATPHRCAMVAESTRLEFGL